MDKYLCQSTISKNKPDSSSSESEDEPNRKSKKPKNYKTRSFQENWKMDYLSAPIPDGSKPQCLICYEILSENKKASVKRHYLTKHATSIEQKFPLHSDERKKYIDTQELKLKQQRNSLKGSMTENQCLTFASYKIALQIAKCQKPFVEGEFIKQCFIEICKSLFSSYANYSDILRKINSLQLSDSTIQRRIDELSTNISSKSENILSNCVAFSLAIDETTDISDISQMCVWYRAIDSNLNITTEILTIQPLHHHCKAQDILKSFNEVVENFHLKMEKCTSITTDGAANMTGKNEGFINLLRKSNTNCKNLIGFHCIIHMESLAAKDGTDKLKEIVTEVTTIINFIKSHALIHREFNSFLEEIDPNLTGLLYYTDVRWLSKGQMSTRFFSRIPELIQFFERFGYSEKFPNLKNKDWILTLAFLVDICEHLNILNLSLQGKNILFPDAISKISAFKSKLAFYRAQLENYDYSHFVNFSKCEMPDNFRIEFYLMIIDNIIDDFSERFDKESMQLFHLASQFIRNPITFPLDSLLLLSVSFSIDLPTIQDELIELQAEHFELLNNDFILFWRSINKPSVKLLASRILSLFASTYACEASFSALNNIKSKRRSRLSDENLRSTLICAVSNLEPDFEFLSTEQQSHPSH